MNAQISETIRGRLLGLGMQISELLAQRKIVSAGLVWKRGLWDNLHINVPRPLTN